MKLYIDKNKFFSIISILFFITIYVLVAGEFRYEDSVAYYAWYKNPLDFNFFGDFGFNLILDLIPDGLSFFYFKILFGIIIFLFFYHFRVKLNSNWYYNIAFFSNIIMLDLLFNTTRSTIASLILTLLFFKDLSKFKKFLLLLFAFSIHWKITLLVISVMIISKVFLFRTWYVLLIPLLYFITLNYLDLKSIFDSEELIRASSYLIDNVLWQWIIPVSIVFTFSLYSAYTLWFTNKKFTSIFLLSLIFISISFIYNGFQYGYRFVPLVLFITLESLSTNQLKYFVILNSSVSFILFLI